MAESKPQLRNNLIHYFLKVEVDTTKHLEMRRDSKCQNHAKPVTYIKQSAKETFCSKLEGKRVKNGTRNAKSKFYLL